MTDETGWIFDELDIVHREPKLITDALKHWVDEVFYSHCEPHFKDVYIGSLLGHSFYPDGRLPLGQSVEAITYTELATKLVIIVRTLAAKNYWYAGWDVDAYLLLECEQTLLLKADFRHHLCPNNKRFIRYFKLLQVLVSTYARWDAYAKNGIGALLLLPITTLCLRKEIRAAWRFQSEVVLLSPKAKVQTPSSVGTQSTMVNMLPLPVEDENDEFDVLGQQWTLVTAEEAKCEEIKGPP
ncbi:Hypothetical protein POVN_LOCUS508 [uncultured virus]|nr:Hypothetical protein POVN_LOCUS508 [uncultured virus]